MGVNDKVEATGHPEPKRCMTCDGCGKVANDEDQTPWSYWEDHLRAAATAVRAGLVRPIPCPACSSSAELVQCPLCEWSTERAPENAPVAMGGLAAIFGISGSTLASMHADQDQARVEQKLNVHLRSHGPEVWLPALIEARQARDMAVDALVNTHG